MILADVDATARKIDRRGLAQHDEGVRLAAQHGADRLCNVRGPQCGGGDLVEQRLEEMIVIAVDDQHFDGERASARAAKRPPNPQPTMITRGRRPARALTVSS
jgi:hypothetical protein